MATARVRGSGSPEDIVQRHVDAYMTATDTPGVAAAYYCQGEEGYYTAGWAIRKKKSVTTETIFDLASVTKVFIGTMLAVQVNAGQRGLCDKVLPYLPVDLVNPLAIRNINLEMLATHTSGLPRKVPEGNPGLWNDGPPSAAVVAKWQNWNDPNHWMGKYHYSNLGFLTLGFAIVGKPDTEPTPPTPGFNELLQNMITARLGMWQTGTNPMASEVAQGYKKTKAGKLIPARGKARDIQSNAQDMLAFLKANLGVLPHVAPTLQAALDATQVIHFHKPAGGAIGLAWEFPTLEFPNLLAKDGASGRNGFSSYIAMLRKDGQRLGIVLLANLYLDSDDESNVRLGKVGQQILMAFLELKRTRASSLA
jgi:beta-lactamase class C